MCVCLQTVCLLWVHQAMSSHPWHWSDLQSYLFINSSWRVCVCLQSVCLLWVNQAMSGHLWHWSDLQSYHFINSCIMCVCVCGQTCSLIYLYMAAWCVCVCLFWVPVWQSSNVPCDSQTLSVGSYCGLQSTNLWMEPAGSLFFLSNHDDEASVTMTLIIIPQQTLCRRCVCL